MIKLKTHKSIPIFYNEAGGKFPYLWIDTPIYGVKVPMQHSTKERAEKAIDKKIQSINN